MKKRISLFMAFCMIMSLATVIAVSAAYPVSIESGIAAPAEGAILNGELIGTLGWGDSEDVDYRAAFDGDVETFFDPLGVGEENFAGMKLDQDYILTEVRIHPRTTFLDRFNGATIQGSKDGNTWTNLWESFDVAADIEFQIVKAADLANNTGYSYYRYVNNTIHGDVGEVEFWGKPAVEPEPEPAPVVEEAPAEAAPVEVAPVEAAPVAVAAPAAPKTSDAGIAIALAALVAVAVVTTKAVRKDK